MVPRFWVRMDALPRNANGKVLASATNVFTRVDKLPERKVWIDSHNRFIVHGKPFFSIGMSWDEVMSRSTNRTEWLDLYATGPFNTVNTYIRDLDKSDLDFFHSRGMMVKEFDEAAFSMKIGELSDIVKTQFGYHVIYKNDAQPETIPSFSDVRDRVKDILRHQRRVEALAAHVADLRAKAVVEP